VPVALDIDLLCFCINTKAKALERAALKHQPHLYILCQQTCGSLLTHTRKMDLPRRRSIFDLHSHMALPQTLFSFLKVTAFSRFPETSKWTLQSRVPLPLPVATKNKESPTMLAHTALPSSLYRTFWPHRAFNQRETYGCLSFTSRTVASILFRSCFLPPSEAPNSSKKLTMRVTATTSDTSPGSAQTYLASTLLLVRIALTEFLECSVTSHRPFLTALGKNAPRVPCN
jgi:hypothetical protein